MSHEGAKPPTAKRSALDILLILGVVLFATGAFGGYLLTAMAHMEVNTWWRWPALRVSWQLGSALLMGAAIAKLPGLHAPKVLGLASLVGVALCHNALLDLVRGPLRVHGTVVDREFDRGRYLRVGPRYHSLRARLVVEEASGERHAFEPSGLQANRLEAMLEGCDAPFVEVVGLRRLDVVLSVECDPSPVDLASPPP